MRCIFLTLIALALGISRVAAQQVKILPAPQWVTLQNPDLKAKPPAGQSGGSYYLLIDEQDNLALKESYVHYAYTLLTTEGVQEMADLSIDFDPSYQTLAFHQLVIHRDGKVINKLHARDLRTIQREQSMDRYLYDGSLSVVLNVQDVRVGDVLEYSFTRKGFNPVFNGHYGDRIYFDYSVPYASLYHRLVVPSEKKLFTKYYNEEVPAAIQQKGRLTEYVWKLANVKRVTYDDYVPGWFDASRHVAVTDFESWAEVAQWAGVHFEVPAAEQRKLRQFLEGQFDAAGKQEILEKATRFVQDEVRYLGFESGRNSHKPHSPLKVYEQRFGDCKDKSLLLCSILRQYDIQAYPMLVNTSTRNTMSAQLPAANLFDHCVVAVLQDDQRLYIDPTISNQGGSITSNYFPNYGEGLIISDTTTALVKLPQPVVSETTEEQTFTIADRVGPVIMEVKTTYTGSEADNQRAEFASGTISGAQKGYIDFYASQYPEIEVVDTLTIADDRRENKFVVLEKYKISNFWTSDEADKGKKTGEFSAQTLRTYVNVSKSASRTMPYRLIYPLNYHHRIRVHLPEAWNIANDSKKITSPYYEYAYEVRYEGGAKELRIDIDYKTLADHVPVEDVKKFINDHDTMLGLVGYSLFWNESGDSTASVTGVSTTAIVASVILLLASIWFAYRLYHEYDPDPQTYVSQGRPIGGWLYLVGFGITFTPIRILYIFFAQSDFFRSELYLVGPSGDGLNYLAMIKLVYNVVILVLSVLLIMLFYTRRTSAPRLFMWFYGLNLAITVLDAASGILYAQSRTEALPYYKDVFVMLIVAAIWIPYFNSSTRVKETFIVQLRENDRWG
ncbi:Transglutaminase-like superfamily protein [Chryseolinea serpens]|uniref:Transglutaminase-like superfamily protein n=1 Tax=Chryseolinea serpens TaxID=947013 RepID=A0A1M5R4U2_9BACT|nr:DUF3857 domain-containing protein [Chryseolinea serpens]SHH20793.1 Transglutaminase-like superfamily protein [Chryseolinea serpens]